MTLKDSETRSSLIKFVKEQKDFFLLSDLPFEKNPGSYFFLLLQAVSSPYGATFLSQLANK